MVSETISLFVNKSMGDILKFIDELPYVVTIKNIELFAWKIICLRVVTSQKNTNISASNSSKHF